MLGVERSTQKVQIVFVWNTLPHSSTTDSEPTTASELHMQTLLTWLFASKKQRKLFHSVWVHFHPASKHVNAITGRDENSWRLLHGPDMIEERLLNAGMFEASGVTPVLRFPPNVFRQANIDSFSNIIREIRKWVIPNGKCVELYGGVGTIGLHCLDLVSSLSCSDENPYNLACFEKSVKEMPKEYRGKAIYRSLPASQVATTGGLRNCDTIIVDPPRKGLDDEVIQALLSPPVLNGGKFTRMRSVLIYVSCGFKAFRRDIERLTNAENNNPDTLASLPINQLQNSNGNQSNCWNLVHVEGHVLFPGSDHIETLAIFERNF